MPVSKDLLALALSNAGLHIVFFKLVELWPLQVWHIFWAQELQLILVSFHEALAAPPFQRSGTILKQANDVQVPRAALADLILTNRLETVQ